MIAQAAFIEYAAAVAEMAAGICKTSALGIRENDCGNFFSKIKITTSRKVNKKN